MHNFSSPTMRVWRSSMLVSKRLIDSSRQWQWLSREMATQISLFIHSYAYFIKSCLSNRLEETLSFCAEWSRFSRAQLRSRVNFYMEIPLTQRQSHSDFSTFKRCYHVFIGKPKKVIRSWNYDISSSHAPLILGNDDYCRFLRLSHFARREKTLKEKSDSPLIRFID